MNHADAPEQEPLRCRGQRIVVDLREMVLKGGGSEPHLSLCGPARARQRLNVVPDRSCVGEEVSIDVFHEAAERSVSNGLRRYNLAQIVVHRHFRAAEKVKF